MITNNEGKELASLDRFNLKILNYNRIEQIIEIKLLKESISLNNNFILQVKKQMIRSREKPHMTKK